VTSTPSTFMRQVLGVVEQCLARAQGNRVKKLPSDEAGEKIIIPAGRLAPAAQ
jgi:hypothetical protein